ncbi:MAG TPA: arylsulfotransferase family protein [Solirubrobacteraceae bacterium]|nr:arylsulfotransferase family protein [Solirubrobacteraceae bacterium]
MSRLLAAAVTLGCAVPALAVATTGATGSSGATGSTGTTGPVTIPGETISPMPGTPDANPHTQISFLGVPIGDLHDIAVHGSSSGTHGGKLEAYSTGTGASFLPSKPFAVGEKVTVSAEIDYDGQTERIGTHFRVAEPYVLPQYPPSKRNPGTSSTVQSFHSRRDLVPPDVKIVVPASDPTLGDIFVSPDSGPGQPGPMIVTPSGTLVWFHPIKYPSRAFDFNMQTYEGKPVLTWWQGRTIELHGQGNDRILSANYTPIATVFAGNGLHADLHEFQITPQNTAFITAFAPIHWNLESLGGPADGVIDDGVAQEIDIRTGLVMWQWDALAHVPVSSTYMPIPSPSDPREVLDYFHINSIDPLANGNVLISSRNTWTSYYLNGTTGQVIWQVGGKHSSFALGSGAHFAWQHDVEMLDDSTPGQYLISMFDNEDSPKEASQSRGLELLLNTANMTASVARQIEISGHPIVSDSQGDVQQLPNGDVFVGWGQIGIESEFNTAGQLTFAMQLAGSASTFRGYRYVWNGQPVVPPAVALAAPSGGKTQLYVSWNGATAVASWTVIAGSSASSLVPVGNYPDSGFETAIDAPTSGPYVRLQAIDASGTVLGQSAVERVPAG